MKPRNPRNQEWEMRFATDSHGWGTDAGGAHGVTRPLLGCEEVRKGGWKEAGRRAEAVLNGSFDPDNDLATRPGPDNSMQVVDFPHMCNVRLFL